MYHRSFPVRYFLLVIIYSFFRISVLSAATYTVTNTNDSGTGSLRQAIDDANNNTGADVIEFNIPDTDPNYNSSSGTWTISPASALPYLLTGYTTIDGTTQETNQGDTNPLGPEIALNGNNTIVQGLLLVSPGNIVKGIVVGSFTYGIQMYGDQAIQNSVTENYLGIDATGSAYFSNECGITISDGSRFNNITNNLISGNTDAGIAIYGTGSYGNTIENNFIGTDITGTQKISNGFGIVLANSGNNIIGTNNLISGNLESGILLNGTGTDNNTIIGNYIGTDADGTGILDNHVGILIKSASNNNIIGGTTPAERNIISGNSEIGVYIEASDSNVVSGNYIGPDITGQNTLMTGDILFQANGIELNTVSKYNIIGGNTEEERNIISGNRVYGVIYYGQTSENYTTGNYIGTDVSGTTAMPNATGICVDASSNHNYIEKNVLSGNISYGIFIVTTGTYYNVVKGNLIGTDALGTDTIPNDIGLLLGGGARYNIIGGTSPDDRNIISGNRYEGIEIADNMTDSNEISGNYIGTDISGILPLGNYNGIGLSTNPKYNIINGNLISGNSMFGLVLYENSDSNEIINNRIGVAANEVDDLGNGSAGIIIATGSGNNFIGRPGEGNIIAYNGYGGVCVIDNTTLYNTISGNSIFQNDVLGGIDLFPAGVTANDAGDNDTGPNELMNTPVITSSIYSSPSGQTWIYGTIDTQDPENVIIEIFVADPDASGYGQGKTYIGYTSPDGNGDWLGIFTGITGGDEITATATDINGNTSEFSSNTGTIVNIDDQAHNSGIKIFPNPATSNVNICYSLVENTDVETEIYNFTGQKIKTLVSEKQNAGNYIVKWGCMDDSGNKVPSGIYLVQIKNKYSVYYTVKIQITK